MCGNCARPTAGATNLRRPTVTGPILIPQREPRIGSVRMVNPSIFSSTVLCPNHAACNPVSAQRLGCGVKGAGGTPHLRSSRYRLKYSGATLPAYRAAPAHCPNRASRVTLPVTTLPAKTYFLPRTSMHMVAVPVPSFSVPDCYGRPSLDGGTSPLMRRKAPMIPYISLSCAMFQFSSPSRLMSHRNHFTWATPAASVIVAYTPSQ